MTEMRTCRVCQIEKSIDEFHIQNSKTGERRNQCKACRKIIDARTSPARTLRAKDKRTLNIKMHLAEARKGAKKRAKQNNLPFNLSEEFCNNLLEKQSWLCTVSGITFRKNSTNDKWKSNPFGISIDRIDSNGGYTKDNVRLVLTGVNIMLNEWGTDVIFEIVKGIVLEQYKIDIQQILDARHKQDPAPEGYE